MLMHQLVLILNLLHLSIMKLRFGHMKYVSHSNATGSMMFAMIVLILQME